MQPVGSETTHGEKWNRGHCKSVMRDPYEGLRHRSRQVKRAVTAYMRARTRSDQLFRRMIAFLQRFSEWA